jgi:hypothetical protein
MRCRRKLRVVRISLSPGVTASSQGPHPIVVALVDGKILSSKTGKKRSEVMRLRTSTLCITAVGCILTCSILRADKPVTDLSANAALDYWQAIYFAPKLDVEQSKLLGEIGSVPLDDAAKLVEQGRLSIKFARMGAKKPLCSWGESRQQEGFTALTPHLRVADDLARLMLLQARLEVSEGRGRDAAEDWISALALARHVSSDGLIISLLFGYGIDAAVIDNAAVDLAHLDKASLDHLARSLDNLRPRPTLASAVRVEQEAGQRWLIAKLKQDHDPNWQAKFTALLGNGDPASPTATIVAGFTTADSLARKLQELDPTIDQLERVASMSLDQFARDWPALEAQLKANPAAALVMAGDFSRIRRAQAMAEARLALFKAAVDVLRHGASSLKAHPDPFGNGPLSYVSVGEGFEISSKLADKHGNSLTVRVGLPKAR